MAARVRFGSMGWSMLRPLPGLVMAVEPPSLELRCYAAAEEYEMRKENVLMKRIQEGKD